MDKQRVVAMTAARRRLQLLCSVKNRKRFFDYAQNDRNQTECSCCVERNQNIYFKSEIVGVVFFVVFVIKFKVFAVWIGFFTEVEIEFFGFDLRIY